jgi:hypothetical protein
MIAAVKTTILSFAVVLTLSLGALNAVYADSATWNLHPTSNDWNTARPTERLQPCPMAPPT